jgi:alpha-L-fucosidase
MIKNLKTWTILVPSLSLCAAAALSAADTTYLSPVAPGAEPVSSGKFKPTWESLKQYQTPEWFRDAKLGIWAHWGPQCQPEDGDWYARGMYEEGRPQYKTHLERYGHPSEKGFKDIIPLWKAEKWDPEKLVAFYKRAGAKYFFAMANHHDNFDMYDSKYQPWNAVKMGPKKDIIGGWVKAAKAQGLHFGASIHAAHAWSWYETAQGADKQGPKAGVPYDGKLTKADGKGQWWEGLDPQDLYAQNHERSKGNVHKQWDWGNGASIPDVAYCTKFYNRTIDLINKYQPDLLYFDDTILPLWPVSNAGLMITAHLYNTNMAKNGGRNDALVFGKVLNEEQRQCITWDIERGVPPVAQPFAWQTDTCIGDWHYNQNTYKKGYKSPAVVVRMLADIVSKNGNLLLNIPVRGDGSIDEKEVKVVEGLTAWMDVNSEAIYATRPWVIFGEGPASEGAALSAQGFNEGKGKPFTPDDVRYTTKGDALYVIALGAPKAPLRLTNLGSAAGKLKGTIQSLSLLGSNDKVEWKQEADALVIQSRASYPTSEAVVFKLVIK